MSAEIDSLAQSILCGLDQQPPRIVSEGLDQLSVADAYQIQHRVVAHRVTRGERRLGYKVGCTSKAIQQQINIASPIWGNLFDSQQFSNHAEFPLSRFANLAVEAEIAVVLSEDPRNLDVESLNSVIERAFPVIELHNFDIPPQHRCAASLIANNGMHAGFVIPNSGPSERIVGSKLRLTLGEKQAFEVEPAELNLTVSESLEWLRAELKRAPTLEALQPPVVVLCGSVGELVEVSTPMTVTATLGTTFEVDCNLAS